MDKIWIVSKSNEKNTEYKQMTISQFEVGFINQIFQIK